jgi:hypothetical protein
MHDSALNNALKTMSSFYVYIPKAGDDRGVVGNKAGQCLSKIVQIGIARFQDLRCGRVIQQCQKQMFNSNEAITRLTGFYKGRVQAVFQFRGNHTSSITHRKGCPCL